MTHNPSQRPRTESELLETIRAIDERAPEHLHQRVRAMVGEQERSHTTLRGALGGMRLRLGALAAAGAALGAALALALGSPSGARAQPRPGGRRHAAPRDAARARREPPGRRAS